VLAAFWALLPVGASASSFGRLDTLFTYILLPIVLAGIASVLRGAPSVDGRGRDIARSRWLSTTTATALALAVLSSAAPVMYLLIVLIVLVGFVLLRPAPGTGVRRAASLFFVVLLPVGLLLPWPAVLLTQPAVLLHGVGSTDGVPGFSLTQLLTIGYGLPSVVGALVLLAAVVLVVTAPALRMLSGAAVVVLGVAAAIALSGLRRPRLADAMVVAGNAGPALLLVAAGLFLVIMAGLQERAYRAEQRTRSPLLGALGLAMVALLAAGAVFGGSRGDVRARPTPALPAAFHHELDVNRALVLTAAAGEQPARLSPPELPQLGDDDLALTPAAARRIADWSDAITRGTGDVVAAAVAQAAASGVGAVVLPGAGAGHRRTYRRPTSWDNREHGHRSAGYQPGTWRPPSTRRTGLQRPRRATVGAGRGGRVRVGGAGGRRRGRRCARLRPPGGGRITGWGHRGHGAALGHGPQDPAPGAGGGAAVHAAAGDPAPQSGQRAQSSSGPSGPPSVSPSGSTVAASRPR